ncbi:MAG: hypothetical protein ACLRSW_06705 [Christensenellaceae bacterium]
MDFACGYTGRIKGRRLTAEFLDKIVPEHPLVVQYQSGHMGIFNSAAMKILGVDKIPFGRRRIYRKGGGRNSDGYGGS